MPNRIASAGATELLASPTEASLAPSNAEGASETFRALLGAEEGTSEAEDAPASGAESLAIASLLGSWAPAALPRSGEPEASVTAEAQGAPSITSGARAALVDALGFASEPLTEAAEALAAYVVTHAAPQTEALDPATAAARRAIAGSVDAVEATPPEAARDEPSQRGVSPEASARAPSTTLAEPEGAGSPRPRLEAPAAAPGSAPALQGEAAAMRERGADGRVPVAPTATAEVVNGEALARRTAPHLSRVAPASRGAPKSAAARGSDPARPSALRASPDAAAPSAAAPAEPSRTRPATAETAGTRPVSAEPASAEPASARPVSAEPTSAEHEGAERESAEAEAEPASGRSEDWTARASSSRGDDGPSEGFGSDAGPIARARGARLEDDAPVFESSGLGSDGPRPLDRVLVDTTLAPAGAPPLEGPTAEQASTTGTVRRLVELAAELTERRPLEGRLNLSLQAEDGTAVRLLLTREPAGAHRLALVVSTVRARDELESRRREIERIATELPLALSDISIEHEEALALSDRIQVSRARAGSSARGALG
jgi:hypothetical protein